MRISFVPKGSIRRHMQKHRKDRSGGGPSTVSTGRDQAKTEIFAIGEYTSDTGRQQLADIHARARRG